MFLSIVFSVFMVLFSVFLVFKMEANFPISIRFLIPCDFPPLWFKSLCMIFPIFQPPFETFQKKHTRIQRSKVEKWEILELKFKTPKLRFTVQEKVDCWSTIKLYPGAGREMVIKFWKEGVGESRKEGDIGSGVICGKWYLDWGWGIIFSNISRRGRCAGSSSLGKTASSVSSCNVGCSIGWVGWTHGCLRRSGVVSSCSPAWALPRLLLGSRFWLPGWSIRWSVRGLACPKGW